jgi:hypothetical protein
LAVLDAAVSRQWHVTRCIVAYLDARKSSAAGTRRKLQPGPVQIQGLNSFCLNTMAKSM